MGTVKPVACPNLRQPHDWYVEVSCSTLKRWFRSLKPALFRGDYERSNPGSFGTISKSAQTGCQSCGLILKGLELCLPPESLASTKISPYCSPEFGPCASDWQDGQNWIGLVFYKTPGKQFISDHKQLEYSHQSPSNILTSTDLDVAYHPFALPTCRPFSVSINLEDRLKQAQGWIQDCLKNHTECDSGKASLLPTLVLDVNMAGTERDVRLVEFSTPTSARYVALSHCWGSTRPKAITNTATVETNKRCISWDALEKTFQDAVDMTRRLGVRYLWIDCFCIIQDDREDWAKESSNMGSIYANSYVTLAAAKSTDSNGGLFNNIPNEYQQHTFYIEKNQKQWPVNVRRALDHYTGSIYDTKEASFPLLYRGWVMQERLLSSRVLYFSDELSFECKMDTACECATYLTSMGMIASKPSPEFSKHDYHQSHARSHHSQQAKSETWQNIIETYSTMKLTLSEDKLPAISGIAKHTRLAFPDQYLAGLWRNSLREDLVWHRDHTKALTAKIGGYRAPTWSWASIDGEITYGDAFRVSGTRWHCYIMDADCIATRGDTTGEISSGYLKVQGYLIECKLSCRGNPGDYYRYSLTSEGFPNDTSFFPDYEICDTDAHSHGDKYRHYHLMMFSNPERCSTIVLQYNIEAEQYKRIGSTISILRKIDKIDAFLKTQRTTEITVI
jgi:hypothetical protein